MKRFGFVGEDRVEEGNALDATLNEMHAAMVLASLDEVDEQIVINKKKYGLYVAGLRSIDGLKIVEHLESERPDYRLIVVSISDGCRRLHQSGRGVASCSIPRTSPMPA
jgi:hypothetical protein